MKTVNPEFVRGFARTVIKKGYGAKAPVTQKDKHGYPIEESWQDVGRRMYGHALFNSVLKEEIAAHAASQKLPSVRGSEEKPIGEGPTS